MITFEEVYACEEKGCGRKFNEQTLLMKHYQKWHISLHERYNSSITRKALLTNLFHKIDSLEEEISETTQIDRDRIYDLIDSEEEDIGTWDGKKDSLEDNGIEKKAELDPMQNKTLSQSVSFNKTVGCEFFLDKLSIVTEEMVGIGNEFKYYNEITSIDLHDKNIFCFKNEQNLNLIKLTSLLSLDLSENFIKDITSLHFLPSLTKLVIKKNKIENISALEQMESLRYLNAEDNEIFSITPLNKCKLLEVLKLKNNKLEYQTSTSQAIKNLKNLKELTIQHNPFLEEILGYRHVFIYRYPQIKLLDGEEITEIDREVARRFTLENNPVSGAIRPVGRNVDEEDEESIAPKEKSTINTTGVRIKDRIVTKMERIPIEDTGTKRTDVVRKQQNVTDKSVQELMKEIELLKKENKETKDINIKLEAELNTVKLELENSVKLNEEYEGMLMSLKSNKGGNEQEASELKQQVELWKREYCELLDKTMSTNISDANLPTNRPQTALLHRNKQFESEDHNNTQRRNKLDDSLSDEDELDELFRKSVTDLEKLKQEIKVINNQKDKEPPKLNPAQKKQNKVIDKPIIIKSKK